MTALILTALIVAFGTIIPPDGKAGW